MHLPEALRRLELAVVTEVIRCDLVHALRSRAQAIANAKHLLETQLSTHPKLADDQRLRRFLSLLETSVGALCGPLAGRPATTPDAPMPHFLDACLAEIIDYFPPEARLVVEVASGLEAIVDPVALRLAVAHLVENALEAVRPGATPVAVVRGYLEADGPVVDVIDRGAGIAPEVSERMFDTYFTTKPGHLGLGLNIVRALARRWRGDVSLRSGAQGVQARLSLPTGATRHDVAP